MRRFLNNYAPFLTIEIRIFKGEIKADGSLKLKDIVARCIPNHFWRMIYFIQHRHLK